TYRDNSQILGGARRGILFRWPCVSPDFPVPNHCTPSTAVGCPQRPDRDGHTFNRAATPLDRGMETKFLSRLNRGNSLNGLKINRYLCWFGTGKGVGSGRSRLRVFYATLARKVPAGPVGRALLHCLEGAFR